MGRPSQLLTWSLTSVGAGRSLAERVRLFAQLPVAAARGRMVDLHTHWLTADALADQLGLGEEVRRSLRESFERWDGKGAAGLARDGIDLTARVVSLADVVTAFHDDGGLDDALAVSRARRGTQFDPDLVDLFCSHATHVFDGLEPGTNWDDVLAAEPVLERRLTEPELDDALAAVGWYADLKSPWTLGHSGTVAQLVAGASAAVGLTGQRAVDVRRAAWVHDLGRLGVPNSIWDKATPLTRAETERIRLHPYLTERMLASSPALARLGAIAVQHHERLDGSGYPRGLSGEAVSAEGRLLGAADTYAAITEPRPHRAALPPDAAARALRDRARGGTLDAEAVEAVLAAAGHPTRRRHSYPAGLTRREVEVLRLLARGLSNREIARELSITPRTAGTHVEHIFTKADVRNRAAAAWFATRHGLMSDP
jgi:HD-GYP domain-containing protein (c-di-GMP phosphodiesterase class II)